MSISLPFLLIMTTLLLSGNDLNWQATGNFTESNTTDIWTYLNAHINFSWPDPGVQDKGDTRIVKFTEDLSTHLNNLWAPAWNVVAVYISDKTNADTVLYGYAFRDHWMWYNGVMLDSGYFMAFIIWKDYNCINWYSHNCNTVEFDTPNRLTFYPKSYNDSVRDAFKTLTTSLWTKLNKNDIWQTAKQYESKITADDTLKGMLGTDTAFTIIMTESFSANFYGRFCAKDYIVNYDKVGTIAVDWGQALILQIR